MPSRAFALLEDEVGDVRIKGGRKSFLVGTFAKNRGEKKGMNEIRSLKTSKELFISSLREGRWVERERASACLDHLSTGEGRRGGWKQHRGVGFFFVSTYNTTETINSHRTGKKDHHPAQF